MNENNEGMYASETSIEVGRKVCELVFEASQMMVTAYNADAIEQGEPVGRLAPDWTDLTEGQREAWFANVLPSVRNIVMMALEFADWCAGEWAPPSLDNAGIEELLGLLRSQMN